VGLSAGLAGAVAVMLIHLGGYDGPAEWYSLDLRFRHASSASARDDIIHVDLDDRSMVEVSRWPWPRETLAGLLDVLAECGAELVMLDVILPEPQQVRYVSEADRLYQPQQGQLAQAAPPVPVFDDLILAETLGRTGNVLLPIHIDFDQPSADELARLALQRVRETPQLSFAEFARDVPAEQDRQTLARLYLRARAIEALQRFALPAPAVSLTLLEGSVTPPLPTLAARAAGTGFVNVEQDPDGVVRRITLLGRGDGAIWAQFALAGARRARQFGREITAGDDEIMLGSGGTIRRIPVGRDATMLINWADPADTPHISATAVMSIWQQRRAIARNRNLARLTALEAMRLLKGGRAGPLHDLLAKADELFARRTELEKARYRAMLYTPADVPAMPAELLAAEAQTEQQIDQRVADIHRRLDTFYLARPLPADADDVTRELVGKLTVLRDRLDRIAEQNAAKQQFVDGALMRLRRQLAGRICFVGSTSTGAADFVPTPLGKDTPGVMVHANILNTILTGQFVTSAPLWVNALMILAAGAVVSLVALARPVVQASLLTAGLMLAYTLVNARLVFGMGGVWLVLMAPLGAMFLCLLLVTIYRQLAEERERRRIRGMFAHALSPTLVDELLNDPQVARLGGHQREITCLFSDLAGFTPLSGQLGPERTVGLLNRYFDCVTEVVQQSRGGYLNKFLGDGVFAMFGAPVAQADHPARAIQAAVDYQQRIVALNAELAEQLGPDEARLHVRIGLAGDVAMVGNCGSSKRMDYTAIGECVNLAARLEAANKFFATGILAEAKLLDHPSCEPLRDELLVRPLGRVGIKGIEQRVDVVEIVGRADQAGLVVSRDVCDQFPAAVEAMQAGRFDQAAEVLHAVAETCPNDRPTAIYLDLLAERRQAGQAVSRTDGVVTVTLDPPGDGNASAGEV
jgi:class 3 adenylate cyclase/CHASE2 domain-containing sensor protein